MKQGEKILFHGAKCHVTISNFISTRDSQGRKNITLTHKNQIDKIYREAI